MKVENATGYTLFDMPANPDSNELKKNWEKLKTYLEKEPDLYKQIVIERKVANISAFIGTPKISTVNLNNLLNHYPLKTQCIWMVEMVS